MAGCRHVGHHGPRGGPRHWGRHRWSLRRSAALQCRNQVIVRVARSLPGASQPYLCVCVTFETWLNITGFSLL